jgi:hypothetical protein
LAAGVLASGAWAGFGLGFIIYRHSSLLSTGSSPAEAILYKVAAGIGQHRNSGVEDCGSLAGIARRCLKIVGHSF